MPWINSPFLKASLLKANISVYKDVLIWEGEIETTLILVNNRNLILCKYHKTNWNQLRTKMENKLLKIVYQLKTW